MSSQAKGRTSSPMIMLAFAMMSELVHAYYSMEDFCGFMIIDGPWKDLWWHYMPNSKWILQTYDGWRWAESHGQENINWDWDTAWKTCSDVLLNWDHFVDGDATLPSAPNHCSDTCPQHDLPHKLCEDAPFLYTQAWNTRFVQQAWNYGGSCDDNAYLLNCDCSSCHTWQAQCGCPPADFENANSTPWLLHSATYVPACSPGFTTHVSTLVCRDGTVKIQGANEMTPAFACYNSVPQNVEGSFHFADEDPLDEQVMGFVVFNLEQVGSDVAAITLSWASEQDILEDIHVFNISIRAIGLTSYRTWLPSTSRPSSATSIVAQLTNAYGRASSSWRTAVYDLHISSLSKPVAGSKLEMSISGSDLAVDDQWWWGSSGVCGQMTVASNDLPRPSVAAGVASWVAQELVVPEGSLRNILCRRSDQVAVVWAEIDPVIVDFDCTEAHCEQQAGQVRDVTIRGSDLPTDAMVYLVAAGTPCDFGTIDNTQGELLNQHSAGKEQRWHIRPTFSGEYDVCWNSCGGEGAKPGDAACRVQKSAGSLTVADCSVCEPDQPCLQCFSVLNETIQDMCTVFPTALSDSVEMINRTWCEQLEDFNVDQVSELMADRIEGAQIQLTTTANSNALEVQTALDVAEDASYAVIADASDRSVRFVDLKTNEVTEIGGAASDDGSCRTMVAGCEYLCSTPGSCRQIISTPTLAGGILEPCKSCGDGGLAAEARFIWPVSVRVAPSGSYVLVVDAGAHRIRRIDFPPSGNIRTVAGTGQAAYAKNPAFDGARSEASLDRLHILQGTGCPLEGPCKHDGALAVEANLNLPWDVAISRFAGQTFFIADRMNNRIRKVVGGVIETVAGCAAPPCIEAVDVSALESHLQEPVGIELLPGSASAFVFAERLSKVIRFVDDRGIMRTLTQLHQNIYFPFFPRITASGTQLVLTGQCDENQGTTQDYNGCQARTVEGSSCLTWASTAQRILEQLTEQHRAANLSANESANQSASANESLLLGEEWTHNYCRDPFAEGTIWCYVDVDAELVREECKPRGQGISSSLLSTQLSAGRSIFTMTLPPLSILLPPVDANASLVNDTYPAAIQPISFDPPTLEMLRIIDEQDSPSAFEVRLVATAAIAVGADATAYALDTEGGFFKISRQNPDCQVGSVYDVLTKSCKCQRGTLRIEQGGTVACPPCDGNSYSDNIDAQKQCACPLRRTTVKPAELFGEAFRCSTDSVEVAEGTGCQEALGADGASDCACEDGTFGNALPPSTQCSSIANLTTGCSECHGSVLCAANWKLEDGAEGIQKSLRLRNGYWADIANTAVGYRIFECASKEDCHWTPYHKVAALASIHGCAGSDSTSKTRIACASQSGMIGSRAWPVENQNGEAEACMGNREGFTCARCKMGYFSKAMPGSSREQCMSCGDDGRGVLFMMADWGVKIWVVAMFYVFMNKPSGGKFMASYMIATAVSSLAEFLQQYLLLSDLDLVPQLPQFVFVYLPSIEFNTYPLKCAFGNKANLRFLFDGSIAIAIPLVFVFLWAISRPTKSLRARLPQDDQLSKYGRVGELIKSPVSFIRTFNLEKDKVYNTVGFLFCTVYIRLTQLSLSLFQFNKMLPPAWANTVDERFPGEGGTSLVSTGQATWYTLIRYKDIHVFGEEWFSMLPFSLLAFVTITVGIFAFHVKVAIEGPRRFVTDASFRNRHKYFYAKYREDRYWWTLVSFTKAVLLNFVATFGTLPGVPNFRAYAVFMLNLPYIVSASSFRPFKVSMNSVLETILHMAILVIVCVGLTSGEHDVKNIVLPFLVLILAVTLVPLLAFGLTMLNRVFNGQKWTYGQEDRVVQSTYVTKAFAKRIIGLRETTLAKILATFSEPERNDILAGIHLLDKSVSSAIADEGFVSAMRSSARRSSRWEEGRSSRVRGSRMSATLSDRVSKVFSSDQPTPKDLEEGEGAPDDLQVVPQLSMDSVGSETHSKPTLLGRCDLPALETPAEEKKADADA